jgi:hypothetical protein
MKDLIQAFEDRLRHLFEGKAAEFTRYAEEEPASAQVTKQLAVIYKDLADVMNR